MIRVILLVALILLAHTMAYEDEVMQERAAMHNGLGCFTDAECETGEEDPEIIEQLREANK